MPASRTLTIPVEGLTCAGCEKKVEERLTGIEGVEQVSADAKRQTVQVAYDLQKTRLSAIEAAIQETGFSLKRGLWQGLKRRWAHFTEENERDNLAGGNSPCCSAPKLSHRSTSK